jgi:uncharacterized protein (DUF1499 family)
VLLFVIKNTKTPNTIGIKDGTLSEVPNSPNAVSSLTEDKEKFVEPFKFKENVNQTKSAIRSALEDYGNIEIKEETQYYIHAVSTTKIMRYHDDIEFLFDEKNSLVHIRSASRLGHSDMGLNKQRYEKLVELYGK